MKYYSIDHKGIEYPSQKAMCDAYGVSQTVFCKRIERGWTLEEALMGGKVLYSKDGVDYRTNKEIQEAFNIHRNTLRDKLNKGYTYEEIIERKTYRAEDHLGNKYATEEDMCKTYGVKKSTYRSRSAAGKSKEEALTGKNGGEQSK